MKTTTIRPGLAVLAATIALSGAAFGLVGTDHVSTRTDLRPPPPQNQVPR